LKDLLKKKQKGEKIEAPKEREPAKVINLMDALRRSVSAERATGGRRKPPRSSAQRRTTNARAARRPGRRRPACPSQRVRTERVLITRC
jgi:DNA end-binding protein Ku